MSDFEKKLEQLDSQMRNQIQQENEAAAAAKQEHISAEQAKEEATIKAHGLAVRFSEKFIEPVMKQIRMKLPGGIGANLTNRERGFAGCGVDIGDDEFIYLRAYFGENGIQLVAESNCHDAGRVYHESSQLLPLEKFDEEAAGNWIEEHALKAYEAFGKHASAFRNSGPAVTYKGNKLG